MPEMSSYQMLAALIFCLPRQFDPTATKRLFRARSNPSHIAHPLHLEKPSINRKPSTCNFRQWHLEGKTYTAKGLMPLTPPNPTAPKCRLGRPVEYRRDLHLHQNAIAVDH